MKFKNIEFSVNDKSYIVEIPEEDPPMTLVLSVEVNGNPAALPLSTDITEVERICSLLKKENKAVQKALDWIITKNREVREEGIFNLGYDFYSDCPRAEYVSSEWV